MKKVYNNESKFFRDWTTRKLKDEAKGYHQTIYEIKCYGTRDLKIYDGICQELNNRGIEMSTQLMFN